MACDICTQNPRKGHDATTATAAQPARSTVRSPLKWHGGKYYLARRITRLMPSHLHYVEPFAGGLNVLFARDPSNTSELVNDLDGRLTNFWRVLQDEALFQRFHRIVEATPLSRPEWERAARHESRGDLIEDAVRFFIHCRQSLSGRMRQFTAMTRTRTRRGMNGNVSEWLSAVEGLPAVHERLRRVVVENLPAVEVIRREDGPGALFYCDPPYLHSTRSHNKAYEHEMSQADHEELLATLLQCRGRVMLSGYPSELYDGMLSGWAQHSFDVANHAAGGKAKSRAMEVLWCNFPSDVAEGPGPDAEAEGGSGALAA